MIEHLPRIEGKCYYMNREVIVVGIFDCFCLVKVKELIGENLFCVDKCTLMQEPDFTNSISLGLFGGKYQ